MPRRRAQDDESHATPLPLYQLVPMVLVLLNESLCGSMIQPFSALLVAKLVNVDKNKAGYLSGVVVGVFMLGQVVSARTWGWLSDQYGRRFPLISGLCTSGLAMLGFGLSTNIYQLAFFRFLHGLFNGNVLVAKTMMADITDKTNEAKGFSFISLVSAIGFLIGPGLGGLLYDPVNSHPAVWEKVGIHKGSIFEERPALLPSLFVLVYTIIGYLVCTFFVRESNPNAKPLPWWVPYICPCFLVPAKKFVPVGSEMLVVMEEVATEASGSEATHVEVNESENRSTALKGSGSPDADAPDEADEAEVHYENFGYKEAFQRTYTRFMLMQYMTLVLADTALKECLNLWVISTKEAGGLDLSQQALSFILLFNSVPLFASNILFHKICTFYKDKMGLFRMSVVTAGIAALNMPLGSYLSSFTWTIVYLLLSTSVRQMCCSWCYSLNTMLTARSAPPGHVGSIMGINQSCGAAMRGIAPLIASPIFAYSIHGSWPFPFNHVFVFYLSALLLFICGYRSYRIRTNEEGGLVMVG
ncbi:transporter-like protein [Angomonas deanei]|nr:transporter-like protein [Angomonas deanei]|eukprot:EPY23534.1 transporter-like protein [Angomonas deanei]